MSDALGEKPADLGKSNTQKGKTSYVADLLTILSIVVSAINAALISFSGWSYKWKIALSACLPLVFGITIIALVIILYRKDQELQNSSWIIRNTVGPIRARKWLSLLGTTLTCVGIGLLSYALWLLLMVPPDVTPPPPPEDVWLLVNPKMSGRKTMQIDFGDGRIVEGDLAIETEPDGTGLKCSHPNSGFTLWNVTREELSRLKVKVAWAGREAFEAAPDPDNRDQKKGYKYRPNDEALVDSPATMTLYLRQGSRSDQLNRKIAK